MPSLFRFLVFLGLLGGLGLRRRVLACHVRQISAARDHRNSSARQVSQEPLTPEAGKAMARRPKASDEVLVELFLDMLAAERGAGENTLAAYRNDLDDLSAHLRAAKRAIADATTDDLRKFIASLNERGFKASSLARRLSAVRQLYRFLYAEGKRPDDPAAVLEGPKRTRALPKFLSIADVDRLLSASAHQQRERRPATGPAPTRHAAVVFAGSRLCHRTACVRVGRPPGIGRAARPTDAGGARQRRQGAARAAQQPGQTGDG